MKYRTIIADCAWDYSARQFNYDPNKHYKTMSVQEMCQLPVKSMAETDSVLLMWSTWVHLKDAIRIAEMWGFCVGVGTRVLTNNLTWVNAETLQPGDDLLCFDEQPRATGDVIKPKFKFSKRRYFKRGKVVSTGIRKMPSYEIILEDGTVLICNGDHKWLTRSSHAGLEETQRWISTEWLKANLNHHARRFPLCLPRIVPVEEADRSYESGYLAAAFDGEGCFNKENRYLVFTQRDNAMKAKVQDYLGGKGFKVNNYKYETKDPKLAHLESCTHTRIAGGINGTLRFLMKVQPARLMDVWRKTPFGTWSVFNVDYIPIKKIRYIGLRDLVTLQTDCGTYIAEGFGAHNTYTTGLPWVKMEKSEKDLWGEWHHKSQFGVGYWFRGASEPLLLCKRGKPPLPSQDWVGLLSPNIKHSRKPDSIYELAESMPGPYLELFARRPRSGWSSWGNEVENSISLT